MVRRRSTGKTRKSAESRASSGAAGWTVSNLAAKNRTVRPGVRARRFFFFFGGARPKDNRRGRQMQSAASCDRRHQGRHRQRAVGPQSQPQQRRRRLVLGPAHVTTPRHGDRSEFAPGNYEALHPVHEGRRLRQNASGACNAAHHHDEEQVVQHGQLPVARGAGSLHT